MHVRCKSNFIELEGGFWGLTSVNGNQFVPLQMHEQLKVENGDFTISFKLSDFESINMWGQLIEIISFTTS